MSFLLLTKTIQQSTKLDGGAEFYFDGVWVCVCMYMYVFYVGKYHSTIN